MQFRDFRVPTPLVGSPGLAEARNDQMSGPGRPETTISWSAPFVGEVIPRGFPHGVGKIGGTSFDASTARSGAGATRRDTTQAAVPAVAFLEIEQSLKQARPRKVGPERFGDVNLGVRDLPQQEVADAHFPARTD